MASRLNPYLNFNGNARQALDFYTSVFGVGRACRCGAEVGEGAHGEVAAEDAGVEVQRLPGVAVEVEVWVKP